MASLDSMGEDCLYLNIWKANDGAEKKPVIVWIHGGAYEAGGTGMELFNCHKFIKENPDVIIVTVAYRLCVLGFLHLKHLPDGKDYPDAQNLGIMDQAMALKWVHENIAGFGGDPDNVTIWGESAGAGSVTVLPLVKGTQQYFKKVIAQSGTPTLTRSTEQAIQCTNELMDALGCKTVADLLKVSAEKLMEASAILRLRISPERDGDFLPLNPYEAYANGAAKNISFLQGCNNHEFDFFVEVLGVEDFRQWAPGRTAERLSALTADQKALVESYLQDIKGEEPYSCLFDQMWFNAPVIRMSEDQTKGGGKSYTYFLDKRQHGVELALVFNHLDLVPGLFEEPFAKTMRKMWLQFVKTGNPSLSADISPDGKAKEWPPYDLENKQVMFLSETGIRPEKETDLKITDRERTYFLTDYYVF